MTATSYNNNTNMNVPGLVLSHHSPSSLFLLSFWSSSVGLGIGVAHRWCTLTLVSPASLCSHGPQPWPACHIPPLPFVGRGHPQDSTLMSPLPTPGHPVLQQPQAFMAAWRLFDRLFLLLLGFQHQCNKVQIQGRRRWEPENVRHNLNFIFIIKVTFNVLWFPPPSSSKKPT